jgi:WD40 repeat protein
VFGLGFRPDGKVLAVANTNSFGVYDPLKGTSADTPGQHSWAGQFTAIAYSPDGKRLAVSDGYTTRMVEPENPANRGTYGGPTPKNAKPAPAAVAWSPDGKWIAAIHPRAISGGPFGPDAEKQWPVRLWSVEGNEPTRSLLGHDEPVTAVAWDQKGKYVATGGADGNVILWDAEKFEEVRRVHLGGRSGKSTIFALAFSPDGKTLAAAREFDEGKNPRRVALIDTATAKLVQDLQFFWDAPPAAVAFSPDGKTL